MVVMEENQKIMSVQKFLEQINYVYLSKYPSKNPKKIVIPHVRVERLSSHIIAKYTKRSNPEFTQSSAAGCKEKMKGLGPTDENLCSVGNDKNERVAYAVQASAHTDSSDSDFPDLMNPKIYEKKNLKKKKKKSSKEVSSGKMLVSKKDIPALMEKAKKLHDSQVKAFKKDKVPKQKTPKEASQSNSAFIKVSVTTSKPDTKTDNIVNDQAEGIPSSPDLHKDSGLVIVSCESLASSSRDQEKNLFSPPPTPSPISPPQSSSSVQKPISLEANAQKIPDFLSKIRANMAKSISKPVEITSVTPLKPVVFSNIAKPQIPEKDNNDDVGHYDSDGRESVGSDETVIFDPTVNKEEAFVKDTKIKPTSLQGGIVDGSRLLENTEDTVEKNMQVNILQANKKALTDIDKSPQSVDKQDEEKVDSEGGSSKRKSDSPSEHAPNKRIKIEPNISPKQTGPMVVIPIFPSTSTVSQLSVKTKSSIDPSINTACREELSIVESSLPKNSEQGKETDCSVAVTDYTGPHPELQESSNSQPSTSTGEIESEPPQVTFEPSVETHIVSSPLPSDISNTKSKCQTTAAQSEGDVSTGDSSLEKALAMHSMRQQPEEMEEEDQRNSSTKVLTKEMKDGDTSEKASEISPKTKSGTKQGKGPEADKKHPNSKIIKNKLAAVLDMVKKKTELEEKIQKLKEEMERKISILEKKKKKLEMNIDKAITQMNDEDDQEEGTFDLKEGTSDKDVSEGSASSPSSSPIPKSDSAHEASKDPSDGSVAESTSCYVKSKGEKMVSGSNSGCVNTETVPKKVDDNKSTVSDKHCASNIKIIEAAKIVCFGNPREHGSDQQNPPHQHKESSTNDVNFQTKAMNQTSGNSAVEPDKNKKGNVSTPQPGQEKIVNAKQPKPSIPSRTDAAVTSDSASQTLLPTNSLSSNLAPRNISEKSNSIRDCTSPQIGQKIPLQQPVHTQQPLSKSQGQPKQLQNVVQQPQQVIQQPSQLQPQPVSHPQAQQRTQKPAQKRVQQMKQKPSQAQAKHQLQHQEGQQVMQQSQQVMQQSHQQQMQQLMQQSQPQQPHTILPQLHKQQPLVLLQQLPQQKSQLVVQQSSQQQAQRVMQHPSQQQPQLIMQQPSQQQPQLVIQQPQNIRQQSPQQQPQLRKQLQGYPSQGRAQPEKVMNVYQNPQVQQMQIQQNPQQRQLTHWQPRPPQPSVVIPASNAVCSSVGNLPSKNCNQKNIALAPRMTAIPSQSTRNFPSVSWPAPSPPTINKNAWQGQQQTSSLALASVSRQSDPVMTTAGETVSSQSSVVNVPQRYSGPGGSQSNFGATSFTGPAPDRCAVAPVTLAGYQVGQGKDARTNTLANTATHENFRNVHKKQLLHGQQFGLSNAMRHHNIPHGAHQTNIQLPQTNTLAGYLQSGAERGKTVGSSEGAASVEEQQWCFICGKVGEFTCCSGIIYCSDICQRMDWERHSKECMKRI